ncbi:hypothetical protein THII_1955 [Thioploca ingrica]|uniref:Uncharacterized protein n=1 Tax=Thioploca ingrica TaxID=40754 RepID=A0A090AKR2_9GAMM|nr:hypothetical protein THII_1955 [Thioploca ingrica]
MAAPPVCGPGNHWVDKCPAGTDITNSTAVVTVVKARNDECLEDKIVENLFLTGPTEIERQAGVPHQIDTEIVSMVLNGSGITVRAGVNQGITPASKGEIVETIPTEADSEFRVYFEIDVPGIGTLHNIDPHIMRAKGIKFILPTDWHFPPKGTKTKLYNENDELVACLDGRHALSITLDSLTAKPENGKVKIEWETATEENNAHFLIARGDEPASGVCDLDPNNYKNVGYTSSQINSRGTSVSGASYQFTDTAVTAGTKYCYALVDVDYDGTKTPHLVSTQPVSID